MLKIFRALALGLALATSPALAANQAPTVMPLSGPMAFSVFLSTYLNPAIQAVLTCNWGPSAPTNGPSSSATAYQCWADTTTNPVLFKYYDGAQWVIFGSLNTTTHVWTPYLTGGTSGGVPYFASAGVMGSSGLLAVNGTMIGGGTGQPPATIAACTDDQIVFGRTSLAPLCRTVSGDLTFTAGVAAVGTNKITNAMMRQSGPLALIGRSANTTGNVADIQAAAASDAVMRESGSTIGFGTINTAGISNNAVTDAKLRAGGALTIMGRSANSGGNVADIAAVAGSDCVYRENASTLACGTLNTAGLANNAVTNAKAAQMAAWTFKANCTGSTANAQDCTIAGLTHDAAPASTFKVMLSNGSNAYVYATLAEAIGALASGVSSIDAKTGAFTTSNGITTVVNDIRLATIADHRMLANTSGSTAVPVATKLPYIARQSATFTTDATSTTETVYKIILTGAGGGSGGANGANAAAGGGGAGGTCIGTFSGVAASTSVTITAGAGGTAGGIGTAGATGSSSTIAATGMTTITATGGTGGSGTTTTVASGGVGGTCTTGTSVKSITGGSGLVGSPGSGGTLAGGLGGTGYWGGGATNSNAALSCNPIAGVAPGSGGTGACSTGLGGAVGAAGTAEVEWISVQ